MRALEHEEQHLPSEECRIKKGRLYPCPYHADRVSCALYATRQPAIAHGNGRGRLLPSSDLSDLAALLRQSRDPAGGWYLLADQREWLEKNLILALGSQTRGTSVRVLEAGTASFVHHYSYRAILAEVVRKLENDLRIELTVLDRCAYPIFQIASIENWIGRRREVPTEIDAGGNQIPVDSTLAEIMDSALRSADQISTEVLVMDLEDTESMTRLGSFDVITEHFLTPVLKVQSRKIGKIRENYAALLKTGGQLVAASTIVREHPFYSEFSRIHEENGMKELRDRGERVWNPFDSRVPLVESLLEKVTPRHLEVTLCNQLSVYEKL